MSGIFRFALRQVKLQLRTVAFFSLVTEPEPPSLVKDDRPIRGQRDPFERQRLVWSGQERIHRQRVVQVREESVILSNTIAPQNKQIADIEQEPGDVRERLAKGLECLPRLLALQRIQAELRGVPPADRAPVARDEQVIGQRELEALTSRQIEQKRVCENFAFTQRYLPQICGTPRSVSTNNSPTIGQASCVS